MVAFAPWHQFPISMTATVKLFRSFAAKLPTVYKPPVVVLAVLWRSRLKLPLGLWKSLVHQAAFGSAIGAIC
jgi:hypothetical protein